MLSRLHLPLQQFRSFKCPKINPSFKLITDKHCSHFRIQAVGEAPLLQREIFEKRAKGFDFDVEVENDSPLQQRR